MLNGTAVSGIPVFTADWQGVVTLAGGAYSWLVNGVQGFVGTFGAPQFP